MPGTRPGVKGPLPDGWQLAADRGGLAGFDQRGGAEIDVVNIGENADSSHNGRAQKAADDDLQMGAAVRAVDQWFMPTSRLPRFSPALGQKL
jgi:hypothetical protein